MTFIIVMLTYAAARSLMIAIDHAERQPKLAVFGAFVAAWLIVMTLWAASAAIGCVND